MSEYCKECDSVTIKVKGIDMGWIGLTGLALMFGALGYVISDLYVFTYNEISLFLFIGMILLLSYSLVYNVFRNSKLEEIEKKETEE